MGWEQWSRRRQLRRVWVDKVVLCPYSVRQLNYEIVNSKAEQSAKNECMLCHIILLSLLSSKIIQNPRGPMKLIRSHTSQRVSKTCQNCCIYFHCSAATIMCYFWFNRTHQLVYEGVLCECWAICRPNTKLFWVDVCLHTHWQHIQFILRMWMVVPFQTEEREASHALRSALTETQVQAIPMGKSGTSPMIWL